MLAIGGAGISGTASLTCTGAPAGATCSVPATVTVSASAPSNFTVSVSTATRTLSVPEMFRGAAILDLGFKHPRACGFAQEVFREAPALEYGCCGPVAASLALFVRRKRRRHEPAWHARRDLSAQREGNFWIDNAVHHFDADSSVSSRRNCIRIVARLAK